MTRCPGCGGTLGPGDRRCIACGRPLGADERVRALGGRAAAGGTLGGLPGVAPVALDGLTLPDSGLALDPLAPTLREDTLGPLGPPPKRSVQTVPGPVPAQGALPVERLSAVVDDFADRGRPARRRPSTAPAASAPSASGDASSSSWPGASTSPGAPTAPPEPADQPTPRQPTPRQPTPHQPTPHQPTPHQPTQGAQPGPVAAPAPSRTVRRDPIPQPGDVIEGYRIDREVGRGGMGRVFRALHAVTGQVVALKMLLPELANDPRLRKRFVNEAQLLAQLDHPNLVPLLGFFDTAQGAFIVMPFVDGITLDKMLRHQGRLAIDVAIDLVGQLASGIDYVHRRDILHRDLKPSNVLVRSDGRVQITDFGIARIVGAERLTRTGMVVGTAEYLAPEQASGQTFDDHRSEIYSLAVLGYEMLTGRVPFRHQNAAQVLIKHVQSIPPPPRTVRPDIPRGVEVALLRGLAKRAEDRYPSCQALHEAMVRGLEGAEGEPAAGASVDAPAYDDDAIPSAATPAAEASTGARPGGLSLAVQVLVGAALGAGLAWGAWQLLTRFG